MMDGGRGKKVGKWWLIVYDAIQNEYLLLPLVDMQHVDLVSKMKMNIKMKKSLYYHLY